MACRVKSSPPPATITNVVVGQNGKQQRTNISTRNASEQVSSKWKSAQGSETQSSVGFSATPSVRSNSNTPSSALSSSTQFSSSSFSSFIPSSEFSSNAMAGDIRVVDGKKQRKLWTLHDRSMMSVHLVKANLAEEGCEEAQVDVAKKLLQDSQDVTASESSSNENARMAIYWLVKSSEQGNEEATRLLEECISTGRGITSLNIFEVRTCISTPLNEKLTFKAARILYFKLNNEEKFITTTQLLARIQTGKKKVTFDDKGSPTISAAPSLSSLKTSNADEDGNKDENDELGKLHGDLNETYTVDENAFERDSNHDNSYGILNSTAGSRQCQSIEYLLSQQEVKMSLEDLLKAAGSFNLGEIPQPNINSRTRDLDRHQWGITSNINAFIGQLLILAAITGASSLTKCVLLGAAFLVIWSSYNLMLWRRRSSNFKDWTEAFRSAQREGSWSATVAETRLAFKSLLPYILVNFCCFLILSVIENHGPIKLVVGSLTVATLLRSKLQTTPSWQTIFIVSTMLLSNESVHSYFPIELVEYFDLLGVESFVKPLADTLPALHIELPNKATVLNTITILIFSSLFWKSKLNIVKKTLPEVLCTMWVIKLFQLSFSLSLQQLEIFGVITIILILLFLLLETNLTSWKISGGIVVVLFIVINLTVCLISLNYLQINDTSVDEHSGTIQNLDNLNHIDWLTYDKECHKSAWISGSECVAGTQFKCYQKYSHTSPTAVKWKGRIVLLKAYDVERSTEEGNVQEASFEITVNIVADSQTVEKGWHTFLHGSDSPDAKALVQILVSTRQFSTSQQKQKRNLIDYILSYRTGDKITFHGILSDKTIGGVRPEIVNIVSLKCVECAVADYEEFTMESTNVDSVQDFRYAYWELLQLLLRM